MVIHSRDVTFCHIFALSRGFGWQHTSSNRVGYLTSGASYRSYKVFLSKWIKKICREKLREVFRHCLIAQFGVLNWPPVSPDLPVPCQWGEGSCIPDSTCQTGWTEDQNKSKEFQAVRKDTLQSILDDFTRRCMVFCQYWTICTPHLIY
jgi:hypothetical protein